MLPNRIWWSACHLTIHRRIIDILRREMNQHWLDPDRPWSAQFPSLVPSVTYLLFRALTVQFSAFPTVSRGLTRLAGEGEHSAAAGSGGQRAGNRDWLAGWRAG